MNTFFLDGSAYSTPRDLHAALKSMMALPDYYGMNADALYDCLSDLPEPVHLRIVSPGEGDVANPFPRSAQLSGISAAR